MCACAKVPCTTYIFFPLSKKQKKLEDIAEFSHNLHLPTPVLNLLLRSSSWQWRGLSKRRADVYRVPTIFLFLLLF